MSTQYHDAPTETPLPRPTAEDECAFCGHYVNAHDRSGCLESSPSGWPAPCGCSHSPADE